MYNDTTHKHSLNSSAGVSSTEVFEVLAKANQFRLEKITSFGHAGAEGQWYDQEEYEWLALLKGSATLQFDWIVAADSDGILGDYCTSEASRC